MTIDSVPLVAVAAVLAPLITELPGARVLPVVVVELALGILAGPVLHLTHPDTLLVQLSGLGMAFLFFMGGMEIDIRRISGRPLALGAGGWLLSLGLAVVAAAVLRLAGTDVPIEFVAAALCTTALGTLMPIMRDAGLLPTRLGRHAVAAGMCGELFPIIVISVVLTSTAERALTAVLLVVFALVIGACAIGALRLRPAFAADLLARTMQSTSQLPVRACILLLVMLVYLATDFGLDLVLGAFAAGMVVRLATGTGEATHLLEHKLDAIGFGFLIPVFFITTGLTFDLDGLLADPAAIALVPAFLVAFLAVRGAPVLLYRAELGGRERLALAFYSATTLPLVVAISTIAVAGGHMSTPTSAALVAAAMLSVVVFPIVAMLSAVATRPSPCNRRSRSARDRARRDRQRRPVRRPAASRPGAGTVVLVAFLVSYLAIRTSARLTRSVSWWPGGVETEGGVHLHHLVWGILLMLFCGFLSFAAPLDSPWWHVIAIGFGIGAGFTLDEFALWVHLEDVYWSEAGRMSFDAVVCTFAFAILSSSGPARSGSTSLPRSGGRPPPSRRSCARARLLREGPRAARRHRRVHPGRRVLRRRAPRASRLHLGEAALRRRPHGQGERALRPGQADDARRAAARRSRRRAPDRRDRDTEGALMRLAIVLFACACALSWRRPPPGPDAGRVPGDVRRARGGHLGTYAVPAGAYRITVLDPAGLSCANASDLLRQFLEDFNGTLPAPWTLNASTGTFTSGPGQGFSIALAGPPAGGGGGRSPATGVTCPTTFSVLHDDHIGSMTVPRGPMRSPCCRTGR